jgi:hypothetical protein
MVIMHRTQQPTLFVKRYVLVNLRYKHMLQKYYIKLKELGLSQEDGLEVMLGLDLPRFRSGINMSLLKYY